jgi:hypothetical protein
MVACLDRDEYGDTEPDTVLIDQRNTPLDDAIGFEPLNAFPAWRRGQADPRADFRDR